MDLKNQDSQDIDLATYDAPYVLNDKQLLRLDARIQEMRRIEEEVSDVLEQIHEGRAHGKIIVDKREVGGEKEPIIGDEKYAIPLNSCGIDGETLAAVKEYVREKFKENNPSLASQVELNGGYIERGYTRRSGGFVTRSQAVQRAFRECSYNIKDGTLKAAFVNIKRIMSGADNKYCSEYDNMPDDNLLLKKEKGSIAFHEVSRDCYVYDLVREMYGELSHDEIISTINEVSISLMQILKLHNSKNLDSGEYTILNVIDGRVVSIPIWKREVEPWDKKAPRFSRGGRYNEHFGRVEDNGSRIMVRKGSHGLASYLRNDIETVLLGDLYKNRTDSIEGHVIKKGTKLLLRKPDQEMREEQ